MVEAWYMDDSDADQRHEHHLNPKKYVNLEELKSKTGVLYWPINVDNIEKEGKLAEIKKDRGYNYEDMLICSKEKLPDYENKLKIFYNEHLHADEEIRLVLEGSGYFDVRDNEDKWIRIKVTKGDLLVLPAGIYHRFTLDFDNYIKVNRLFCGEPVWTAVPRPAEEHPAREKYLKALHCEMAK
ncbi:1,2-dihydroxy-3-keto-5-methylthiopentene dioxygenase-like [Centruroides sculpturatus]|uniref:1,2-dihydroxy-3-keto-5-methylthiopentene dioxygenase-like n=1 Tax=Centruroides sculpturatus TaxID=218467 RepID=UPI000C6D0D3A|nr:1,2-dihydroxy-3-keto-5-methylthiopentene dioxygenase-like [Centruroides sculpturatus]